MKMSTSNLLRSAMFAVLALVLLVGGAGRVFAQDGLPSDPFSPSASAARLTEDGLNLYKDRDYRRATERFLQAYALQPDPNLLFNTARCYEAMGDRDAAIEKYEAFLSKADADPQGKRRAADAVRTLRQERQASTRPAAAFRAAGGIAAPGRIDVMPATEPAVARSSSASVLDTNQPQLQARVPERSGSPVLSVPKALLGAGVLAAAIGAISYAMGAADHNKVTSSAGYGKPGQVDLMTESQARELVDSGDSKKRVGGVAVALGGALLITAAILSRTGTDADAPSHDGKDGTPLALGIAPLSGGGQIFLRRAFR